MDRLQPSMWWWCPSYEHGISHDRIADLYMDCDSVTHDGLLMTCMSVVGSHGQDTAVCENDGSYERKHYNLQAAYLLYCLYKLD